MRTPLFFCSFMLLAAGFLLGDEPVKPAEPDPELAFAEQELRGANIATDGPALVAFFKTRMLTPADQDRLAAAVRNLGDDTFEVREKASAELSAAGRLALVHLKQALAAKDVEVVCRARRCIEEIDRVPESARVRAAAYLIAAKRPDGATEALLGSLPWLDDEELQESAVFPALAKTALKDGEVVAAIKAAMKDKDPVRRAAAAYVLGRGNAETRRAVTKLLADAEPRVRYQAAAVLIRARDKSAVTPLIALLTDASPSVAWQTEDLLCRLAGEKAPAVSVGQGADAERRKARDAWEAWWKEHGDKVDLATVNLDDAASTGTVIAELGGKVWEAGPDGKARWEFGGANSPIDARSLPGGRVLVAEHGGQRVTERDRKGNILWQHAIAGNPVVAQRLPNGNTFIATYQELTEVTPDQKVLYSHKSLNGMIYHAEKLRDGRFVYITSGNMIYELDATGKQLKALNIGTVGNTSGWASVERLTSGNYLVALYSNNLVVEVDKDGKKVWSVMSPNPGHATRLRNGNVLVANIEGRSVIEFDRTGKKLWEVQSPGRPFHAWRR